MLAGALTPLPAEIKQQDSQKVVLDFSAHVASPYSTQKQSTTVKLASVTLEDFVAEPAPVKRDGASVKYGVYEDVTAYSVAPARLHCENNAPFATMTSVTREVEVSMWGNVAVEEHYEMRHTGEGRAGRAATGGS